MYKYNDKTKEGYKLLRLNKKQYENIFPNRKYYWHTRYEVYINVERGHIIIDKLYNRKGILVGLLTLPVGIVLEGVRGFDFKRDIIEQCTIKNQKKYGHFTSEFLTLKCNGIKSDYVESCLQRILKMGLL